MKQILICLSLLFVTLSSAVSQKIWTTTQATEWYAKQPWLVGCNFIPSTAINELEMWQADTFDPITIDRELGWRPAHTFESDIRETVRWYLATAPRPE